MKELSQEIQSQRHSLTPEDLTTYLEIIIEDTDGQPVIIRLTDRETRDWNGSTWDKSENIIRVADGKILMGNGVSVTCKK